MSKTPGLHATLRMCALPNADGTVRFEEFLSEMPTTPWEFSAGRILHHALTQDSRWCAVLMDGDPYRTMYILELVSSRYRFAATRRFGRGVSSVRWVEPTKEGCLLQCQVCANNGGVTSYSLINNRFVEDH